MTEMKRTWLVQRLRKPYNHPAFGADNPFSFGGGLRNGGLNDEAMGLLRGIFSFDYMGAAEFEFGAIPQAFDRLRESGDDIVLCEWTYKGHAFDFLYRKQDGEPFDAWTAWAKGGNQNGYKRPAFDGKEPPFELRQRIAGKKPWSEERGWQTAIWWALEENVMWSFKEDGHLQRMLESMKETEVVELRG